MQRILCLLITLLLTVTATWGADSEMDARYRYYYIEAVRQQDMGNYANSLELLNRCIQIKPDAAETCYALGAFYMAFNMDDKGMYYLKRAVELEPGNADFAERLARTYLYKNDITEAAKVYEQLISICPEPTEYLDILSRIYEQQRDYPKMLETLQKIEMHEGKTEDLTLSKMQVYSYMGDQDGAYNELKGLIDAHPLDMNLQVMLGNWLQSNGRNDEALETFKKVLKEDPENAQGQMSLMDYYRARGESQLADSLMYTMLINPRTDPDTRITMMRTWIIDNDNDSTNTCSPKVMGMFDRVLATPQKTTEVLEMKAAYLMARSAPTDSISATWRKILEVQPENIGAQIGLIDIMWKDTIDENVIRECKKAVEYMPDEPMLYQYLGIAQSLNKHNTDAISTLKQGISCITNETKDEVAADMYALLGDLLQREGRSTEAFNAYDSCLVYDPNKLLCLNNYAYYLSLQEKDLKRAEKMSYRTITAEPENSTYLDTYAWILYQQKRYEEAKVYIDQAIKCDTASQSGDIIDHAGDIYYRLGDHAKAMELWNKALTLEVDNEAVLRKKIKKGKL